MAGQQPSRRQVLQALGCAMAASAYTGFDRWSFAFAQTQHVHGKGAASLSEQDPASYRPVFFRPEEYRTVEHLAELVLPGTPVAVPGQRRAGVKSQDAGATDVGVAEFIDFMVSEDNTLQSPFRNGLQWLDHASGAAFLALSSSQQNALLERIAFRANFRPEDKPGQEFFKLFRRYTVIGFYTSRLGLESLGYPGLSFYAESPAVPQDAFLKSLGV